MQFDSRGYWNGGKNSVYFCFTELFDLNGHVAVSRVMATRETASLKIKEYDLWSTILDVLWTQKMEVTRGGNWNRQREQFDRRYALGEANLIKASLTEINFDSENTARLVLILETFNFDFKVVLMEMRLTSRLKEEDTQKVGFGLNSPAKFDVNSTCFLYIGRQTQTNSIVSKLEHVGTLR